MLSFELSAIDIILTISVAVLLILYATKIIARNDEEKSFMKHSQEQPTLAVKTDEEKSFKKHLQEQPTLAVKTDEEKSFKKHLQEQPIFDTASTEKPSSIVHSDHTECPRGFGRIRKIGEDNSVSERCLGCYRIMECYSKSE